jgi:hypothetical protein
MWIIFKIGLYYMEIFTPTLKFGSQLSKHAKTISQCCPLSPSQFTCYSSFQGSTPQLSNNNCPWQPFTMNSRPHCTAAYLIHHWPCSTLNCATLASAVDCPSYSVTQNWVQDSELTIRVILEMIGSLSPLFSNTTMKLQYYGNVRLALRHNMWILT